MSPQSWSFYCKRRCTFTNSLSWCYSSAASMTPFMASKPVPPGKPLHMTKVSSQKKAQPCSLWTTACVLILRKHFSEGFASKTLGLLNHSPSWPKPQILIQNRNGSDRVFKGVSNSPPLKLTSQTSIICTVSTFLSSKLLQNTPMNFELSMVFPAQVQSPPQSSPQNMVRFATAISQNLVLSFVLVTFLLLW